MKKTKVIAYKNMPCRPPIGASALLWLLLDRTSAAGWVWGACAVLALFMWIAYIYGLIAEEKVDVFERRGELK